jgi:hypothetical protein
MEDYYIYTGINPRAGQHNATDILITCACMQIIMYIGMLSAACV